MNFPSCDGLHKVVETSEAVLDDCDACLIDAGVQGGDKGGTLGNN